MKKLMFMLVTILVVSGLVSRSFAQSTVKGLYLTADDYLNNKLSYTAVGNKAKLHLNDFLEGKTIAVIADGKKEDLPKEKVFGYRDEKNHSYRFFNNKVYQIVDTAKFCLYNHESLAHNGKNNQPLKTWYFSVKAGSPVLLLTEDNMAEAFHNNHNLKYMVEAEFRSDNNWGAYDLENKEYKIKELFAQSMK